MNQVENNNNTHQNLGPHERGTCFNNSGCKWRWACAFQKLSKLTENIVIHQISCLYDNR